jgi:large subunit ribosomal protein L29
LLRYAHRTRFAKEEWLPERSAAACRCEIADPDQVCPSTGESVIMAKKKKEYKDQSVPELQAQVYDLEREIFQLRNELATQRKLEKPHLIRAKRRDKARILTLLTQKTKAKEAV